jgi:hypothetical protein
MGLLIAAVPTRWGSRPATILIALACLCAIGIIVDVAYNTRHKKPPALREPTLALVEHMNDWLEMQPSPTVTGVEEILEFRRVSALPEEEAQPFLNSDAKQRLAEDDRIAAKTRALFRGELAVVTTGFLERGMIDDVERVHLLRQLGFGAWGVRRIVARLDELAHQLVE